MAAPFCIKDLVRYQNRVKLMHNDIMEMLLKKRRELRRLPLDIEKREKVEKTVEQLVQDLIGFEMYDRDVCHSQLMPLVGVEKGLKSYVAAMELSRAHKELLVGVMSQEDFDAMVADPVTAGEKVFKELKFNRSYGLTQFFESLQKYYMKNYNNYRIIVFMGTGEPFFVGESPRGVDQKTNLTIFVTNEHAYGVLHLSRLFHARHYEIVKDIKDK